MFKKHLFHLFFFAFSIIAYPSCNSNHPIEPPYVSGSYTDAVFNNTFKNITNLNNALSVFSIPLINGSTLWLMNGGNYNNLNGVDVPCVGNRQSIGFIQQNVTWTCISPTTNLIPPPSMPTERFLMKSGFQWEDTVFVYCSKVNSTGVEDSLVYVAKLKLPSGQFIAMDSFSKTSKIAFGLATAADTLNGFTYVYGTAKQTGNNLNIFVARHKLNSPYDTWSYFVTNNQWSTNPNLAASIFTTNTKKVSIKKVKTGLIMLYQDDGDNCGNGTQVFARYAGSFTTGFSAERKIFTIPNQINGKSVNANFAQIHPSQVNSNNEILITYNQNGLGICEFLCLATGFTKVENFTSYGFRIPLKSLNAQW